MLRGESEAAQVTGLTDAESVWQALTKLKDDIVSEHHVDLANAKREALERINE